MIYVTADLHLGHRGILTLGNGRPFKTVEEMDETIIGNWNSMITHRDVAYILGDVCLGNLNIAQKYLEQLNGQVYVMRGNHDDRWIKKFQVNQYIVPHRQGRGYVRKAPVYKEMKFDGNRIVMFHYRVEDWQDMYKGSVMLHGHSHGSLPPVKDTLDVCVDDNDYKPYTLEQAIAKAKEQGK